MERRAPQKPHQLPEYCEVCLNALVDRNLAQHISLGGGLALLHYLDYRTTSDVDAWWAEATSGDDQRRVVSAVAAALGAYGVVTTRSWGDVVSIELGREGRKIFSFQIARRTAQLEPAGATPWIDVPLDSIEDVVASKMVALVERGAPRDFRDIYAICVKGLTTPEECWQLWRRRQERAGSDTDHARARLAITTHLARIVQHRPLDRIAEPEAKRQAAATRQWYEDIFLRELK